MNNFLLENNNKLKLIRKLKFDEYNKLNIIYNNYLYLLNRYLFIFKFRFLIYKLELFVDKWILKYNYLYIYIFWLRSLYLNKKYKYISILNKKVNNINIRMVSKLLEKGDILYLDIIFLIYKKKNIINNYKLNNLFNKVYNLIKNIINNKFLLEEIKLKKDKENNYDNLLNLNLKKLNFDKIFNNIYINNEINIRNIRKVIFNYLNFDEKIDVLNNNNFFLVEVMYYNNNYS